jgi:hypothetical protein
MERVLLEHLRLLAGKMRDFLPLRALANRCANLFSRSLSIDHGKRPLQRTGEHSISTSGAVAMASITLSNSHALALLGSTECLLRETAVEE